MLKERVLDFKVYLPQLEVLPGKFKGGVRRYGLQKNENSPALVLGDSLANISMNGPNSNNVSISSSSVEYTRRPYKTPDKLSKKEAFHDIIRYGLPRQGRDNTTDNNMLELISHPAFRQPKYTKQNPKISFNNPITGYSSIQPQSLSFGKRTNLIGIGSRLVGQDRYKG